jgi:hypothetical protein
MNMESAESQQKAEHREDVHGAIAERDVDLDVQNKLAKALESSGKRMVTDMKDAMDSAKLSQEKLEKQIERLTEELDRMLEDVPLPVIAHNSTRLAQFQQRAKTLCYTISVVEGRIQRLHELLTEKEKQQQQQAAGSSSPKAEALSMTLGFGSILDYFQTPTSVPGVSSQPNVISKQTDEPMADRQIENSSHSSSSM